MSIAADDLVQDCLTRALGKLHLWQEGRIFALGSSPSFTTNTSITSAARCAKAPRSALNETEPSLSRAPQQGKRLELRDLERAIAKLPEEQRSVVLLVGLEGMRYEEVAAVLDVPVGTIRSRLSRGREALAPPDRQQPRSGRRRRRGTFEPPTAPNQAFYLGATWSQGSRSTARAAPETGPAKR